jgi:hypothetical protein
MEKLQNRDVQNVYISPNTAGILLKISAGKDHMGD